MNNKLAEIYKKATYKLSGHGPRQVNILKKALDTIDDTLVADIYGNGNIINDFEDKIADLLGKESAVFFPSGTMAQQIALRMWCDESQISRVAYHPLCHLEIYEEDGLKELHSIETILLGEENRLFNLEDLKSINGSISTLLIELPQRSIGGQAPSWKELTEISKYCKDKGIKMHLDGARLWETAPNYGKSLMEICSLFDSIYVSFYKGIGSIAGAILAGDKHFMEKSKIWKRRYGGDLISLYPYILSADYYLNERLQKMDNYYHQALELAHYFNSLHKAHTIPQIPVSNMFHVHFEVDMERVEEALSDIIKQFDIGITPYLIETEQKGCMFEVSIGDSYEDVPNDVLAKMISELNMRL